MLGGYRSKTGLSIIWISSGGGGIGLWTHANISFSDIRIFEYHLCVWEPTSRSLPFLYSSKCWYLRCDKKGEKKVGPGIKILRGINLLNYDNAKYINPWFIVKPYWFHQKIIWTMIYLWLLKKKSSLPPCENRHFENRSIIQGFNIKF